MNAEPGPLTPPEPSPEPHRLFLFEPGWSVALKVGSERVYCYMMSPGQDFYHRLLDGEVYLFHGDEKLCLACAERRGLLSTVPRGLRETLPVELLGEFDITADEGGFEVKPVPGQGGI